MTPLARFPWILALGLASLLAACGDDGTGPEDPGSPEFPTVDAAVLAEFCVRGTLVPTATVTGTLNEADCPTVSPVGSGPGTNYETWRVRVAGTQSVTLEISSGFDSFIDVFRITNLASPQLGGALVDFDDDGTGGVDARLTVTLEAGVEYWVMVSGFGPEDVGPYSMEGRN